MTVKKILCLILAFAMVTLSLVACSNDKEDGVVTPEGVVGAYVKALSNNDGNAFLDLIHPCIFRAESGISQEEMSDEKLIETIKEEGSFKDIFSDYEGKNVVGYKITGKTNMKGDDSFTRIRDMLLELLGVEITDMMQIAFNVSFAGEEDEAMGMVLAEIDGRWYIWEIA